jgi:hypothetical protein
MELTITSQKKEGYLLIESKGSIQTKEELFRHSQLLFDEIMKQGAQRILINDIEMHFPLELFPYFGLVQDYVENYPPEIRSLQIGVVVAEEYKDVAESWETLCVSRGLQFYAFTSLEEASQWLLEIT